MDKYNYTIFYCPKCGYVDRIGHIGDFPAIYCKHHSDVEMIECEETYEELYKQLAIKNNRVYEKQNGDLIYATNFKDMVEFVRNKYVLTSDNKLFSQNSYEFCLMMERPSDISSTSSSIATCPRCHSTSISTQKKGFGVGKAAAGIFAAGPIGGVAGAAGSNKVYNICQKCGHKWTPGK